MRPYRFPTLAPSRGLAIGTGVAQGFNNALSNLAKTKMQMYQMQTARMNAQAMQGMRQAQAQMYSRRNQDVQFGKVQLAEKLATSPDGTVDPKYAPLVKQAAKEYFDNIDDPQKLAYAHKQFDSQLAQNPNRLPPEMPINLNSSEQSMFSKDMGNNTRENVANTRAGSIVDVGAGHDAARIAAAKTSAGARNGGMNPTDKAQLSTMTSDYMQTHKAMLALDQPKINPLTGQSQLPDPAITTPLKAQYQQHLDDLGSQIKNFGKPSPAQGGAGGTAPGGASLPQALPSTQWQNAQPGQFVATPDNKGFYKAAARDASGPHFEAGSDGQPRVYPATQAPPPIAAPPGAPAPDASAVPAAAPTGGQ